MLYSMELRKDNAPGDARLVLDFFTRRFEQSVVDYAFHLMRTVAANCRAMDDRIRTHAHHWHLSRLAMVDKVLMRIALAEMLYEPRLAPVICINEAIDISKIYSTGESGQFINGVLDAINKAETAAEKPASTPPAPASPA
jgi:N utilization substance protein B